MFARDVTEQQRAGTTLGKSEARYSALFESCATGVYVSTQDGRLIDCNDALVCILGYQSKDELLAVPAERLYERPGDRAKFLKLLEKENSVRNHESSLVRKDGSVIWCVENTTVMEDPDGGPSQLIGTLSDVSERKQALTKLRESEERLRLALDASGISLWDCEVSTGRVYLSEGWSVTRGGESKATLTTVQDLLSIGHPDDRKLVLKALMETLQRAASSHRVQHRVRNIQGEWIWIESTGRVTERDQNGRARRMIGTNVDITDRKQAEQTLRESGARLKLALSAAQMGVWEWDAAANRITWGEGMHSLLGVAPGNFAGTTEAFAAMTHPEDRAKFLEAARQATRTGDLYQLEFRVIRPDGKTVWIADQGRAELDASGKVLRFLGVARNVSQQREMREQVNRSQKMEAVGQLAGGVAHDFNNLLTVICGHAEMLLERPGRDAVDLRDAAAIQKAAERAAKITNQLLAFGRKQVLQPQALDLAAVVAEISEMLRKLIGSNIELRLKLPNEALWIKADEGQIEQVVVNLVVNARDAMPEGGILTIEVSSIDVGPYFVRQGTAIPEGKYACLVVRDTGFGVDAATQARIFEPFFRTKSSTKGIGLKLATVYGIVKQSGGWIWLESEPDRGASFELFLPEVSAPDALPPTKTDTDLSVRGKETILVVDDEEPVRDLAAACLRIKGYNVLLAEDGPNAFKVAETHQGPIHALVTDVVLPGIDGVNVARRVSGLRPGIRVLYVSGYPGGTSVLDEPIARGEAFLQKPFTLEALARKIREMLA